MESTVTRFRRFLKSQKKDDLAGLPDDDLRLALTEADKLSLASASPVADRVTAAARKTDKTPSEKQIAAENYRKGKVGLHNLTISIENPKGSTRSGTSPDGKAWSVVMGSHYGYILGTAGEAKDGDHVDCFIGPCPESEVVFIVDQVKADGSFDEHKCLLGWYSETDARKGYLANYSPGWKCGPIRSLTMPQFKKWLESGNLKKPIEGQAIKCSLDESGTWFGQ